MKKIIFLSLIISLMIVSCTQEKKSPVEGTWKMVYAKWDGIDITFPAQINGGQIKIWSNGYFAHVGEFRVDTSVMNNSGVGSYTLDGNRYEESFIYRGSETALGKKVRLIQEIRNDTLIQSWPADDNWKLAEKHSTEKYIRLK
jgi:hypothetical protein